MTMVNTRETNWYLLASRLWVQLVSSCIEVDIRNSAVKKSIPKDWLPLVFTACETPLLLAREDNRKGFDSSSQSINGWLSLVKERLYSNPAVEDIFVDIEDDDVDVWVVIPKRDLDILHRIIEVEGDLFDTLVSGENPPFLIDFHIIYRCGRNLEELAPTRAIRLPR